MTNRQKLILNNIPFAQIIAGRMYKSVGNILEYEEILSCATIGLIDAIDKYKDNYGAKFNTYAFFRMKGVIIDELRKIDHLSRNMRQKIKDNLIEDITLVDYDKVKNILPKNYLEINEDKIDIELAIKKLSKIEQIIIYYHYYYDLSDGAISTKLNKKYSTIRRIRIQAIQKLKIYLGGE